MSTEKRDDDRATAERDRLEVARLLPERADYGAVLATRISDALIDGEPLKPSDVEELRGVLDDVDDALDRAEQLDGIGVDGERPEAAAD